MEAPGTKLITLRRADDFPLTGSKGQDWGPKEFKGNWVEIYRREGDTWKKRLDMWNVTPAPAPTTTSSPTSSKQ